MSLLVGLPLMDHPVGSGVYEAEPDQIKLFVGQIPKEYEEPEVRSLLEEFGPVDEVNIIKGKDKKSKGTRFDFAHSPRLNDVINNYGAFNNSHSLSLSLSLFVPGCAFVKFCMNESAMNAQQNLHEKRTLPAVSNKELNYILFYM